MSPALIRWLCAAVFIQLNLAENYSCPKLLADYCGITENDQNYPFTCCNMKKYPRIGIIMRGIQFPRRILIPNWFNAKFYLFRLRIQDSDLTSILPNTFKAQVFAKLVTLELNNLDIDNLPSGAFNGLGLLTTLKLIKLKLDRMNPESFLDLGRLQSFLVYNCTEHVMDVSRLASGVRFANLKRIVFNGNNLKDKIQEHTFAGIGTKSEAITFDLRSNQIESVSVNAFNEIKSFLVELNLSDNRLKVLPVYFFNFIGDNFSVKISLQNNEWMCTCELNAMRLYIIKSPKNFDDGITCAQPDKYEKIMIRKLPDLCKSSPSTNVETNKGKDDPNKVQSKNCPVTNGQVVVARKIDFNQPLQNIKVERSPTDQYSLTIDKFPSNYFLLYFVSAPLISERSICLTNDNITRTNNVRVEPQLKPNQNYRFCLMAKLAKTIPPLDCISFFTTKNVTAEEIEAGIWIQMKFRSTILASFWFGGAIAFVSGVYLAFMVASKFPNSFCRNAPKQPVNRIVTDGDESQRAGHMDKMRSLRRRISGQPAGSMDRKLCSDASLYDSQSHTNIVDASISNTTPPLPPRNRKNLTKSRPSGARSITLSSLKEAPCCESDDCICYVEIGLVDL